MALKMWHTDNEKWKLVSLSESLETNIPSSVLMPRSKNFASIPLCSNYPGYMHLNNFENSSSSFIAQRSTMNRLVA